MDGCLVGRYIKHQISNIREEDQAKQSKAKQSSVEWRMCETYLTLQKRYKAKYWMYILYCKNSQTCILIKKRQVISKHVNLS